MRKVREIFNDFEERESIGDRLKLRILLLFKKIFKIRHQPQFDAVLKNVVLEKQLCHENKKLSI